MSAAAAANKEIAYSLYILNKAGSLLYQRDFHSVPRLDTNDYIFVGSTFHGLHAISSRGVGPASYAPSAVKGSSGVNTAAGPSATTSGSGSSSTGETTGDTKKEGKTSQAPPTIVPELAVEDTYKVGPTLDQLPITALPGITCIETRDFKLQSYQTLTGLKFVMTGSPNHTGLESMLKQICLLYVDYVLKNPFYKMDHLIRCEQFETRLLKYIASKQGVPDR